MSVEISIRSATLHLETHKSWKLTQVEASSAAPAVMTTARAADARAGCADAAVPAAPAIEERRREVEAEATAELQVWRRRRACPRRWLTAAA
jgi:hypothetical protein